VAASIAKPPGAKVSSRFARKRWQGIEKALAHRVDGWAPGDYDTRGWGVLMQAAAARKDCALARTMLEQRLRGGGQPTEEEYAVVLRMVMDHYRAPPAKVDAGAVLAPVGAEEDAHERDEEEPEESEGRQRHDKRRRQRKSAPAEGGSWKHAVKYPEMREAVTLLSEMEAAGHGPTTGHCNLVLKKCAKKYLPWLGIELLEAMAGWEVVPDADSLHHVVAACCRVKVGYTGTALRLLLKAPDGAVQPQPRRGEEGWKRSSSWMVALSALLTSSHPRSWTVVQAVVAHLQQLGPSGPLRDSQLQRVVDFVESQDSPGGRPPTRNQEYRKVLQGVLRQ
jgi:hypothetical protein